MLGKLMGRPTSGSFSTVMDESSVMPSKRLILSYIVDWIVILGMAAVGGGWNSITPYKRPISLVDLSISFPYKEHDTVPFWVVIVVALLAPGVIIFIVSMFFIPGPTADSRIARRRVWMRKVWEWNAGWMGLGLSLALAFLVTQGLKNLVGKARPDLLERCMPDLDNFKNYVVGNGFGHTVDPRWVRVSAAICKNTDKSVLDDGFRSWPSGHSSFSWAGLLYLSLFVCSKFAIAIPFLPPRSFSTDPRLNSFSFSTASPLPYYKDRPEPPLASSNRTTADTTLHADPTDLTPLRNQAAAPPTYLLVLALIPVCGAAYICATRYTDFRHHGLDIFSGALIGIFSAVFAFRWYHLPISRGAGWAWGARTRDRAFAVGVGLGSYVGSEGWGSARGQKRKLERVEEEREANGAAPERTVDV